MELIPLGLHVYRRYKIVYMRLHWSRMSFIKFISINIRIRWIQKEHKQGEYGHDPTISQLQLSG